VLGYDAAVHHHRPSPGLLAGAIIAIVGVAIVGLA
jgi:hypothetical protein